MGGIPRLEDRRKGKAVTIFQAGGTIIRHQPEGIIMSTDSSLTLEQVQEWIGKEAEVVLVDGDRGTKTVTGTIVNATVAGIPFKEKGKAGVQLLAVGDIYDINAAPVKATPVKQRKVKPVAEGKMRQHLADAHGVSLKWCKEASEADARLFHDGDGTEANPGIDHADCGHIHVVEEPKADERTEAINEGSEQPAA